MRLGLFSWIKTISVSPNRKGDKVLDSEVGEIECMIRFFRMVPCATTFRSEHATKCRATNKLNKSFVEMKRSFSCAYTVDSA